MVFILMLFALLVVGLVVGGAMMTGKLSRLENYQALAIIAVSLGLGALADVLLRNGAPGLNAALWITALLAVFWLLSGRGWLRRGAVGTAEAADAVDQPALGAIRPAAAATQPAARWLLLPALLFDLTIAWRDSGPLLALNVLGLAAILGLVAAYARGGELARAGLMDYVLGAVAAGIQAGLGLLPLLGLDIRWRELSPRTGRGRALAVVRGLLIALPLVLIFGGLFAAADMAFARLVGQVFTFDMDQVLSHVILTLVWAWLAAGWLRAAAAGKGAADLGFSRPEPLALGPIETGVVLGALNLLFLAFVLVEFRYFFGGAALVQATTGLTYADYARRGFFELLGVAALVLPVLLVGHWLQPADRPGQNRLFRSLALSLVVLLFIIMASAWQRMMLYQQAFGLTAARFYATAAMIWLGLLCLWFVATVLRGRRERFAVGVLVSAVVLVFVLSAINPDSLITRTNLARVESGQHYDATYSLNLSADAVPDLVKALPNLPQPDRKHVATWLLKWSTSGPEDWRNWNWGRMQARAAVTANLERIRAAADEAIESGSPK